MACVKSLGVHKPSALDYLTAESILPPEPSGSLYHWSVYDDNGHGEEELLSTQKCVVWSQGGVIRRVFRFDREGQNVKQAILTRFPPKGENVDPPNGKNEAGSVASDARLARALVVILRHQAHVFYLHGSSHIVNLPFEVDKAFPAPTGLLLQRQMSNSEAVSSTPVPPVAPPNSFMSSQRSAWTSSNLDFRPKSGSNLSKQTKSLSDFTVNTSAQMTKSIPRLFMLRDPVAEIGLVCEPLQTGTAVDFEAVDGNEEVCYVSPLNEAKSPAADPNSPLIIVVTVNRAKSTYTIWNTMSREQLKRFSPTKYKRKLGRHSLPAKRHSSFTTRMSTGTTTPALRGSDPVRDNAKGGPSFLSTSQGTSRNRLSDAYQLAAEEDYGFSGTDGTNFPQKSRTSKGNRRTSSLMARAELSSQDQNAFTDLARNPASANTSFASTYRRGPSFTGVQDRGSFGRVRLSGRASTPGSFLSDLEESSQHDSGHVDGLDIIAASSRAQVESNENMEGLSKELIMFKIKQVPFGRIHAGNESALVNGNVDVKVFTAASAMQRNFCGLNENLSLFFIDHATGRASELLFKLRHARVTNHDWISAGSRLSVSKDSPEFSGDNVLDMVKVSDHGLSRVICLRRGVNDSLICITPKSEAVEDDTQSSITELQIPTSQSTDSNHLKGQPKNSQIKGKGNDEADAASQSAQWYRFANIGQSGAVDIVSREHMYHKIQIRFQPRNGYVLKAMDLCCLVSSPYLAGSNDFRAIWCKVMGRSDKEDFDAEWHSFVTTLFYFIILRTDSYSGITNLMADEARLRRAPFDTRDRSNTEWLGLSDDPSWAWLVDELSSNSATAEVRTQSTQQDDKLNNCVGVARRFIKENDSSSTLMPPPGLVQNKRLERTLQRLLVALNLFYEEQKLSSTSNEDVSPDFVSLGDVVAQIGTWLGWPQWRWNSLEAAQMLVSTPPPWRFDTSRCFLAHFWIGQPLTRYSLGAHDGCSISQTYSPFSIVSWVDQTISGGSPDDFPDLESIFVSVGKEQSPADQMEVKKVADCLVKGFTPRTYALRSFFQSMRGAAKPTQQIIEYLVRNNMALRIHETLPEVLQLPTRAYISNAQAAPLPPLGASPC